MEGYRIYTGNNCKVIKKNIPECLVVLSKILNRINTTFNNPNLNNMRNVLIAHIKTLLNKINTCKDLSIPEINSLYESPPFDVLCLNRGFKQHEGECWNDSIMMFFCYQDGIKETVQRKLYFLEPEEIIELAYSKREINLPEMFKDEKNGKKTKLLKGITNYLRMMKTKFTTYYNDTKYPMSKDASIAAAMEGLEIIRLCPSDILNHGANPNEISLFIQILSYFLLNNELENKLIQKKDIVDSLINQYLGFIVHWSAVVGKGGHATLINTCDRNVYHFDDNFPTPTRINKITDITNNNLYVGISNELTCNGILGIKIYDKTTDKISRMERFLKYELDKNIFDNIQYYIQNGASNGIIVMYLNDAITDNKIDKVRELLNSGLDLNQTDISGLNLLIYAIGLDKVETVRLLLSKGVNKNFMIDDMSILDYAKSQGNQEIINLLR
jgi:hypothetical protein